MRIRIEPYFPGTRAKYSIVDGKSCVIAYPITSTAARPLESRVKPVKRPTP